MAAHFVERLLILVKDPSCHDAVLAKGESAPPNQLLQQSQWLAPTHSFAVHNAGLSRPLLAGMLNGIGSEIKNTTGERRYRECALEALRLLAANAACPAKVDACPGLRACLEELSRNYSDIRFQSKAVAVLEALDAHSSGTETTMPARTALKPSMFANAHASAVHKSRTITIDMAGLLPAPGTSAGRQVADAYTHALLLVPGVTSVSIDAASSRAVIFSRGSGCDDVRPALLRAVNSVREIQLEQQREAAAAAAAAVSAAGGSAISGGVASPSMPSTSAAMYLDEDEEDDFFGDGAVAERRGRETVEERLARQRRQQHHQQDQIAAESGVLDGIAKGVAAWMGMGW